MNKFKKRTNIALALYYLLGLSPLVIISIQQKNFWILVIVIFLSLLVMSPLFIFQLKYKKFNKKQSEVNFADIWPHFTSLSFSPEQCLYSTSQWIEKDAQNYRDALIGTHIQYLFKDSKDQDAGNFIPFDRELAIGNEKYSIQAGYKLRKENYKLYANNKTTLIATLSFKQRLFYNTLLLITLSNSTEIITIKKVPVIKRIIAHFLTRQHIIAYIKRCDEMVGVIVSDKFIGTNFAIASRGNSIPLPVKLFILSYILLRR